MGGERARRVASRPDAGRKTVQPGAEAAKPPGAARAGPAGQGRRCSRARRACRSARRVRARRGERHVHDEHLLAPRAVGAREQPYTRGTEVSRPFDDVVAEAAALAARGVKELTLLGQNVNAWRGAIDGRGADFAELLRYVAEIDGLERIRYTTSHPREFTQRLIDAHAELPALATDSGHGDR